MKKAISTLLLVIGALSLVAGNVFAADKYCVVGNPHISPGWSCQGPVINTAKTCRDVYSSSFSLYPTNGTPYEGDSGKSVCEAKADELNKSSPMQPKQPDNPTQPTQPDNPTQPTQPDNPTQPTKPEAPTDPTKPTEASTDPNLCNRLQGGGKEACEACMGDPTGETLGFWTGIGCISTNPVTATQQLLELLLGIGGFFVVTQILIGSFTLIVSRGNPQALEGARTRIVNSVMALLLIVFSVTILEFVGVSILNIPGFFDDASSSGGGDEDCMKECMARRGNQRACELECNGV